MGFNCGLIPNGQFHIIVPVAFDNPTGGPMQTGFGDTELGFKYRFIDEDKYGSRPMVGVFPFLELPTGDESRALGASYVHAYFPLSIQKSFGDWTTYGGGGYWINHGDDTANRDYWFFGWLLQRQVTNNWSLALRYSIRPPLSHSAQPTPRPPSPPPALTSARSMISTIITTCWCLSARA